MKIKKSIDDSISVNAKAVLRLEKKIKGIQKDKNKKESSKKDVQEAIQRLDAEISNIKKDAKNAEVVDVDKPNSGGKSKKAMKCKYYNRGFCKYRGKCRFSHPGEVCDLYVKGECQENVCAKRHPKACKWLQGVTGCKRGQSCEFSHDIHICGKSFPTKVTSYKCEGCKSDWQESRFVVKHSINNMEIYFCLNCEDWIKHKNKVLDEGWSLFDQDGNLNYFV